MRISPINQNYKTTSQIQNSQYFASSAQPKSQNAQNINFKSVVTTGALYKSFVYISMANKTFNSTKSYRQLNLLKRHLDLLISNPGAKVNSIPEILTCLSRIKSSQDQSAKSEFLQIFSSNPPPTIAELKEAVVKKVFPLIDDNDPYQNLGRAQFVRSMYNMGEFMNDEYVQIFKELPDKHYNGLKKEIVNMGLYTIDEKYRPTKEPEQYIYDLKLINTLDKNFYSDFLEQNIDGIYRLMQLICKYARKKLTKNKNYAYRYYCNRGENENPYYLTSQPALWKDYISIAFNTAIEKYCNNSSELAKALNINVNLADDIIKDSCTHVIASKMTNSSDRQELYKQRINEKLALSLTDKSSKENDNYQKIRDLETKIIGIRSFINDTDDAIFLNTFYEDKINELIDIKNKLQLQEERSANDDVDYFTWRMSHYD